MSVYAGVTTVTTLWAYLSVGLIHGRYSADRARETLGLFDPELDTRWITLLVLVGWPYVMWLRRASRRNV